MKTAWTIQSLAKALNTVTWNNEEWTVVSRCLIRDEHGLFEETTYRNKEGSETVGLVKREDKLKFYDSLKNDTITK